MSLIRHAVSWAAMLAVAHLQTGCSSSSSCNFSDLSVTTASFSMTATPPGGGGPVSITYGCGSPFLQSSGNANSAVGSHFSADGELRKDYVDVSFPGTSASAPPLGSTMITSAFAPDVKYMVAPMSGASFGPSFSARECPNPSGSVTVLTASKGTVTGSFMAAQLCNQDLGNYTNVSGTFSYTSH